MTTSDEDQPSVCFVWVWLPGATEPVVAGRLDDRGETVVFTYGRSYLSRSDAISLYEPELPLEPGTQAPTLGPLAGCIADAAPDAWGRRVIESRRAGGSAVDLSEIAYLLESSSNRQSGLDFQASPSSYQGRDPKPVPLDLLVDAAARVEANQPLPQGLADALLHGTSIGGARPKATVERNGRQHIAKFASSSDDRPVEKGEFVAMELARRCGLSVARVELTQALGKDVLLVERFDRPASGQREIVVSANTILRLGPFGIGASYCDLADEVRRRFVEPTETLRELFSRIVFNILVGNTDDHARNHAAFWDGAELRLTPAYDLCPQRRSGNVASQVMAIAPSRSKESRLAVCVDAARSYGLSSEGARELIDHQVDVIRADWDEVCDAAELTPVERSSMWGRQFLNAYAFEGY